MTHAKSSFTNNDPPLQFTGRDIIKGEFHASHKNSPALIHRRNETISMFQLYKWEVIPYQQLSSFIAREVREMMKLSRAEGKIWLDETGKCEMKRWWEFFRLIFNSLDFIIHIKMIMVSERMNGEFTFFYEIFNVRPSKVSSYEIFVYMMYVWNSFME